MGNKEVKWGAILSYLLVTINALYGFIVTPYILTNIGEAEYGVYKTIYSLSASMMILDLGMGNMIMRYIAKYKSEKREDKIPSFISMATGEGVIIMAVLSVICVGMYVLLPTIYKEGLSAGEMSLAKSLFIIMAVGLVAHIIENILNGIIAGYNRFTFANGLKLVRVGLRIALVILFLGVFRSALYLAVVDLFLTLFLIASEYIYIKVVLHQKVRVSFRNWDMEVFKDSFRYAGLLFLTAIAIEINTNLDNIVIGAFLGSSPVTVYSMGLMFFSVFSNLSTSISGVMLPTVTNILAEDKDNTKIQKTIVNIGRIQFGLMGAAVAGFLVLGKNFIHLWLGEGFDDVYIIALLLMVPSMFELCVNVCLAILRAKNMLGFRTMVVTGTMVMNAIVTIVGVKLWGYYAAAIGTALSYIIGSLIIMNIYYYKKLSLNMLKLYGKIFSRIWICLIISGTVIYFTSKVINDSFVSFCINAAIFVVVYGVTLVLFGLKKEEKKMIPFVKRFVK